TAPSLARRTCSSSPWDFTDWSSIRLANTRMASIAASKLGSFSSGAPSPCCISRSFTPRLPLMTSTGDSVLEVRNAALHAEVAADDQHRRFGFGSAKRRLDLAVELAGG